MTGSEADATPTAVARVREAPTVSVATIAWGVAGVLFLLFRLGPIWRMPVGGIELDHLAGAWLASTGVDDPQFIPTFLQAVAALSFEWTESPIPVRIFAFVVAATIPVAVYLLRPWLGEAGALLALLVLAVNPLGIALTSGGGAVGLDAAAALWLAVVLLRGDIPAPAWAPVMLVIATGGPLPLIVALGALIVWALRRDPFRAIAALWMAGGAVAGVVAASFEFGHGWDGITAPPLDILVAGYERTWASGTAAELAILYALPILAAGLVALVLAVPHVRANRALALFVAWFALSLAWLATSLQEPNPLPVAAVTTSAGLLVAPMLVTAITAMLRANWQLPAMLIGAATFVLGIVLYVLGDWSRANDVGSLTEQILVSLLVLLIVAALVACAARPATRASLVAPALVVGLALTLVGAVGIGTSARNEVYPSPRVAEQAPELLRTIDHALTETPGVVVVHPRLADELAWQLRSLDRYTISSTIPEDAVVVLWLTGQKPPEGMALLAGSWSATRTIEPPPTALRWLRWLSDRNTLDSRPEQFAIYTAVAP